MRRFADALLGICSPKSVQWVPANKPPVSRCADNWFDSGALPEPMTMPNWCKPHLNIGNHQKCVGTLKRRGVVLRLLSTFGSIQDQLQPLFLALRISLSGGDKSLDMVTVGERRIQWNRSRLRCAFRGLMEVKGLCNLHLSLYSV